MRYHLCIVYTFLAPSVYTSIYVYYKIYAIIQPVRFVYHLLPFVHMRPPYQPTFTSVALSLNKF